MEACAQDNRVHLALREAPRYADAALDPALNDAFKVGIGFESEERFVSLFADIRRGRLPASPSLFACTPSRFDAHQAPPGAHTALCWAPAPYALKDGGAEAWDAQAPAFARRCLEVWRAAAPNLTDDNILAMRTISPAEIPRKFRNMRMGSVFGGRVSHDQLDAFRPTPSLADFRTPIAGLYLAGAGQHPGGGILGACGAIAAETVADDLNLSRWWS